MRHPEAHLCLQRLQLQREAVVVERGHKGQQAALLILFLILLPCPIHP